MDIQRDKTLDIIKALAIVLVVYGHTFGSFHDFVYLFHLPVFLMLSGYCWNSSHSASKFDVYDYIFKRIKRLLIPYWMVNIVFYFLTNVFSKVYFYTSDIDFLNHNEGVPVNQALIYPVKYDFKIVYEIITFKYMPQLSGMTWFLYTLFMICAFNSVLSYYFNKIQNNKIRIVFESLLIMVVSLVAYLISLGRGEGVEARHLRLPACYLCFLIGVFFRKIVNIPSLSIKIKNINDIKKKCYLIIVGILSFVLLCVLNNLGCVELSKRMITTPFYLLMCTLAGWLLLYSISFFIKDNVFGDFLGYIGQHTIPILWMHCVGFKIVSYFIIMKNRLPLYMLASFPVIFDVSECTRIVYTIVGTLVPVLVLYGYNKLKSLHNI